MFKVCVNCRSSDLTYFGTVVSLRPLRSKTLLTGCSSDGVTTILQYKSEAVKAFEKIEQIFSESHDDIKLKNESTVLKTRLIREDYPGKCRGGYSAQNISGLINNIRHAENKLGLNADNLLTF